MEVKERNGIINEIVEEKETSCFTEKLIDEIAILKKYAAKKAKQSFFSDTQSASIDKITKALCEFILELPQLKTDKSAMGRYKYQSLPTLLESVNPVMAKFGLKAMQPPHTLGDKTYIITKIVHTSGQYFRCVTLIPQEYTMAGKTVRTDQNLQAMGGAQTYIKRYALKSILGIDADDDTDGGATYQQRNNYGN